jgi:hypothetical protein
MLNITIKTIPNESQRYPTVGDWVWDGERLTIYVSDMGDWKAEFLVAYHELAEVMLCRDRGISQESVDAFDKAYEAKRPEGDESEPGDSPDAPYRKEHFFATNMERLMSEQLGVNWQEYDSKVAGL